MGYTMLKNSVVSRNYKKGSLEQAALSFIRNSCQGLRFSVDRATDPDSPNLDLEGTSLKPGQIPYNMEKDIDRLCLENAVDRFLKSGKKEDAFDVYFCYLEMFVGDYEKTRRMIELLSEFEANGSGLLMKHRDHYSHSVYVFVLGLAIYESNELFQTSYKNFYGFTGEKQAAFHFLQYWGLAALFHDIGYPFELPFEQVASYFEVEGSKKRAGLPFVAYQDLDALTRIGQDLGERLAAVLGGAHFDSTDELFAHLLADRLGETYGFTPSGMLETLKKKPSCPNEFNHFMDHAYFSATVLFQKLFVEMKCRLERDHLDSLTAILMHNSLYKFSIARYKSEGNKPFRAELHPLAYMLMLCDELQCWDRVAYGRNTKKELYPMGAVFDFSDNDVHVTYLFDEKQIQKVDHFKDSYIEWLQRGDGDNAPRLKAYSDMYIKKGGISDFQQDIERIVDMTRIRLRVNTGFTARTRMGSEIYLSDSNFINLYNFAIVLNGRWNSSDWKHAKEAGREEAFLSDEKVLRGYTEDFKKLSLEYKLSNINQAKAFAGYMNAIGCFYTDKAVDFELVDGFTREELLKIGVMEHRRWLQEHYDMGWKYGQPTRQERDLLRLHADMIPAFGENQFEVSADAAAANYDRLDKAEQDKDTEPMECLLAMLRMFDGLRIYRLN